MYKEVLVPLDGSIFSESALRVAEELLSDGHARVTLMMVSEGIDPQVERPLGGYDTWASLFFKNLPAVEPAPVRHLETKDQALEWVIDQIDTYLKSKACPLNEMGIQTRCVVKFGSPAEEIVNYARESGVQLIIMATHGRSGLERLAFGSVAEAVLKSGVAPVLLIRPAGLKRQAATASATVAN